MSNSHRIDGKGMRIDRARPASFTLDGRVYQGFHGDTLASALIANGRHFVARSFKYHRPRGFVSAGVEEPNALFGVGEEGRFEPNERATMTPLRDGLVAQTQNRFPTLESDVGALNGAASRMLPAGFYYKTFMWPRAAWKHVFEPVIRRAAGLGRAPTEPDPDRYEHFYASVDVLVAGGGVSGIIAAKAAAAAGARVLLVEQGPALGGRMVVDAPIDGARIEGAPAADWLAREIAALEADPNVVIRLNTQVSALEDHNYALLYERVGDDWDEAARAARPKAPRRRLWRVRAEQVVAATGAIERPIAFACNDAPGVMLASAVRDYIELYGAKAGDRVVLFTNNDDAYRTALSLRGAGVATPVVLDAREGSNGDLPKRARAEGVEVRFGQVVSRAVGRKRVEGVEICEAGADPEGGRLERLECDCVAMSGGWSPAAHLWSHIGGKLAWDAEQVMFRPDPGRPPMRRDGAPAVASAGAAAGETDLRGCLETAGAAGVRAARVAGYAAEAPMDPSFAAEGPREDAPQALWSTAAAGAYASGGKTFVDFQNDVTVADVALAAREGYESVEHLKRYTTLGMATDQGKLSNVVGLALLAESLGTEIPSVGTTTFRPPYTPIALGVIAGPHKGALFKPVRETPMQAWHKARGAVAEPVGDWRRPFAYPARLPSGAREETERAVYEEIRTVRSAVGLLDASTLGKILVKGPDAGAFLDLLYTNRISTLKPGRCRYALMCDDNGYLFDDGVIVRLDDGAQPGGATFLCHTTSGGADRVHAWMEEWLQTEWPHLQVHVVNVTEQYAQIAVAGPKARDLLAQIAEPGLDLSAEALPFMAWRRGALAGVACRIHRISFSGELSYEIAAPAGHGGALWEALLAAGAPLGAAPYGTEALHIMRAEKGFIMIGDETDGTVTPLDLGLDWAVSKKKDDFIGKRAMERPFLREPHRRRLVGLLTEDPSDVLPQGAYAVASVLRSQKMRTIGHVTSSYWSPTLERSIAMALIERGPERMGETIAVPTDAKTTIRAKVVSPVFYDPDNTRQAV